MNDEYKNNHRFLTQTILPGFATKSFDSQEFICSSSNQVAYDFLTSWPKFWGVLPYPNTIILSGPESSGKTHLAKIWQKNAGGYNLLPLFEDSDTISRLVNYSAYIIEDIEYWPENKLLHFFNLINEQQKYLLLTTRSAMQVTLPDLKSRLGSVMQIKITPPDDELVKILLFKYFSGYYLSVSEGTLNFLVKHLPRQFNIIFKMADRIAITALSKKRNITIPFVKEMLCSD